MASELHRLGSQLSLTEEEEAGWVLPSGVWHSEPLNRGFFVVGRLASGKSFHPEALQYTLRIAFSMVRSFEFKMIEGDRFLLKFFHVLERDRVLERCPWAYDKQLLVLAPVDTADDPNTVDLNWCDFHVHIHGLPLGKMTREISTFIGNKLGRFKEVDLDGNGEAWGSSVRIRVALDITKPLSRALKIRTILGDEQLISFTYERLPNFCYLCGCFGHLSRQCELQFQTNFQDPGQNTPFGSWLRASTPSWGRGRSGGTPANTISPHLARPTFVTHSSLQSKSQSPHITCGPAVFGTFPIPQPFPPSSSPTPSPIPTTDPPAEVLSTPPDTHINDLNLPPIPLKPSFLPAENFDPQHPLPTSTPINPAPPPHHLHNTWSCPRPPLHPLLFPLHLPSRPDQPR
ncbi:UNVERIFIED_CONTAM: hypothetical protein Sradi_3852000 [Sesamum radiatum]|uniref:CCHC-type domain-containing protein n=1 Tax=Sesamum radiatum TaxID=300843 RepID=A0AAW2Q1T4_SESRA